MNLTKTIAKDFYGNSYNEPVQPNHSRNDIINMIANDPELKREVLMRLLEGAG